MIRKQRRGEQDGDAAGGGSKTPWTTGPTSRRPPPATGRPPRRGHAEKDAARRALVEAVALNEIRPGPESVGVNDPYMQKNHVDTLQ
ncbi:MAG: hypothetical protein ACLR0N_06750 [Bilophila wadsworthia]